MHANITTNKTLFFFNIIRFVNSRFLTTKRSMVNKKYRYVEQKQTQIPYPLKLFEFKIYCYSHFLWFSKNVQISFHCILSFIRLNKSFARCWIGFLSMSMVIWTCNGRMHTAGLNLNFLKWIWNPFKFGWFVYVPAKYECPGRSTFAFVNFKSLNSHGQFAWNNPFFAIPWLQCLFLLLEWNLAEKIFSDILRLVTMERKIKSTPKCNPKSYYSVRMRSLSVR